MEMEILKGLLLKDGSASGVYYADLISGEVSGKTPPELPTKLGFFRFSGKLFWLHKNEIRQKDILVCSWEISRIYTTVLSDLMREIPEVGEKK